MRGSVGAVENLEEVISLLLPSTTDQALVIHVISNLQADDKHSFLRGGFSTFEPCPQPSTAQSELYHGTIMATICIPSTEKAKP